MSYLYLKNNNTDIIIKIIALPFLKNTILFLYPVLLVSVLYIILLISGFNIGKHSSIMFLYI